MKNIARKYCLILLLANLIPLSVFCQVGWQWATGSYSVDWGSWGFGQPNFVTNKFGNSFLCGNNYGTTAKFGDFVISNPDESQQLIFAKIDADGHYKWVLSSRTTYVNPMAVAADNKDNAYILMQCVSSGSVGPLGITAPPIYSGPLLVANGVRVLLLKLSPTGTIIWYKFLSQDVFPRGLGVDGAGNLYLTGNFGAPRITMGSDTLVNHNAFGGTDVLLVKYRADGTQVWARNFGPAKTGREGGVVASSAVSENGGVAILGIGGTGSITYGSTTVSTYPSFLIKYDSSGNVKWITSMGPARDFYPRGITIDRDENTYLTMGENHGVFRKYNDDGELILTKTFTGPGESCGDDMTTDRCNNVWVFGKIFTGGSVSFEGHENFVPGDATAPAFVVGYDQYGNYLTSMVLGSGGSDFGFTGISVDNQSHLYLGGQYNSIITLGSETLTNDASGTMFVAKYKYEPSCDAAEVGELSVAESSRLVLYPNPATDELTVTWSEKIFALSICNVLGQEVLSLKGSHNNVNVDLADLPQGVYIVRVNGVVSEKFIKK